jgi:transposase
MWWTATALGIEVPQGVSSQTNHMRGAVHTQITTIGLDIAKNVFQVHGIDATEKVVVRKQLRRSQVLTFFKAMPPCLVGMEAHGPSLGA